MSDHGSASMDMLPSLSNPESQPITMCYILMEPTLHTAISVDFSRLLLQHTKQQPKAKPEKKHTSDDTGGGDGGDGSEDPEARLRCYVRFSTQHLRWIVEYAYVEPDQTNNDMDRSSTLLGFGIELALRFTNPPCTGAEHFKWPAGRRSVAVFRCMEDGSLQQLQRGDPAIVKRKFFRVGQPTVRSEGWMPGSVCAVWAVERLYCSRAPGLAKQEEWEEELGEEEGMLSLEVRSGLEKRKNNSLTSFLEFVGVTQSSPKKLQYSDAPKVTITPTTPETERCIENELPVIPTLERRTKSWSGMLNSKEERVKSAGQLSPRKESAGDLFIVKAPITPKKERSGFRVPFRRRNTHDMEKGKRPLHPMPSPLIRSISACDLPSSPMAQNDIGQKDDVRMRRRSSDQKVVRFTENTRPTMEVDERWAGSDGNVSKTPTPSHICSSPESITPSSIPRGRHFVAAWEDGESSDADTLVNDFNGVIQETTEWRDTTPGKGACGDRIDLNDLWLQTPYKAEGGCELLPPSPVSPPDPEYIERIESEMEQIFANTHLFEDEPEEKELDISEMTEEQAYANYVGKVSQWLQFPPKQVSSEYMPKSKAHWDWRALELRGRDPFTVFSGPGLNLDDGSGIKFPATF